MSILKTGLLNLVTLPFGIVSTSIERPLSKEELVKKIDTALYKKYDSGMFTSSEEKDLKDKTKASLEKLYDGLSIEKKMTVMGMAVSKPEEYLNLQIELEKSLDTSTKAVW